MSQYGTDYSGVPYAGDGSQHWVTWGGETDDDGLAKGTVLPEVARLEAPYPTVVFIALQALGPGGGGQSCRFRIECGVGRATTERIIDLVVGTGAAATTNITLPGRILRVTAGTLVAGAAGAYKIRVAIAPQYAPWLEDARLRALARGGWGL